MKCHYLPEVCLCKCLEVTTLVLQLVMVLRPYLQVAQHHHFRADLWVLKQDILAMNLQVLILSSKRSLPYRLLFLRLQVRDPAGSHLFPVPVL